MNFTLQDIFDSLLAFLIFPLVLLFPGYVISYVLNLFDFKRRRLLTKYIIAIVTSVAVVPVLFYLLDLFFPFYLILFTLAVVFVAYILIVIRGHKRMAKNVLTLSVPKQYKKAFIFLGTGWVVFSILSLVDIQWGHRLYHTVVSLDFATRVTLVNAITRTGVPPVNPSYFPGHLEYITSLYYFWYILCSVIDQIGGKYVDSRSALIAGDVWCGLALMAIVSFYLKLRNRNSGEHAWKTALLGISLLTISGVDVIPALISMVVSRVSFGYMWPAGDIEHWNEQITAWLGSVLWVPHHIAAMIACLLGFILLQYYREKRLRENIPVIVIIGASFASAVGLSTWIAITFAIFWVFWILFLVPEKGERDTILFMILAGIVALFLSFPFLVGIIRGGTGASGLPFVLEVRRFDPVIPFVSLLPTVIANLIYLLLLPFNYLMELGFFFLTGMLWIKQRWKRVGLIGNPYFAPEIIMLSVVILVCSFVRSAIAGNDLGWRGWLLGQFVLLVWAIDVLRLFPFRPFSSNTAAGLYPQYVRTKLLILILLFVGFSTSIVEVTSLRFWPILVDFGVSGFPNGLSPDTKLGFRNFSARLAYGFINDHLPSNTVLQQNPLTGIDRPSGLYGARQFAISANAPFNVPVSLVKKNSRSISKIFTIENPSSWKEIDLLCGQYFIDVLIVSDLDPLWIYLPSLYKLRPALYKNDYYAVIAC